MNPELTRQRVRADSALASCSDSVHFALHEACSRSFLWFHRRADQRVVLLRGEGGIVADALIPHGNQPLDPWSPVPVVLDRSTDTEGPPGSRRAFVVLSLPKSGPRIGDC